MLCRLNSFFFLSYSSDPQERRPHTLLSMGAPRSATKVQFRIDGHVTATALSSPLVFEKLHLPLTFRAWGLEDIPWFPIPHVLSWTFHFHPLLI